MKVENRYGKLIVQFGNVPEGEVYKLPDGKLYIKTSFKCTPMSVSLETGKSEDTKMSEDCELVQAKVVVE